MSEKQLRDKKQPPQADLGEFDPSIPNDMFPILAHQPLSAPCYRQDSGVWCNLATLTNCAQFHQGKWPTGGLGSLWGETGLWYLAGQGKQDHERAYFWQDTLKAVGMLDEEHAGEFSNGYRNDFFEFKLWLFPSRNPDDWRQRWDEFKAYVESVLWGKRERGLARRPVALGWHHTRLITGSDGENIYLNDSGGGHWVVMPWENLRQDVINAIANASDDDVKKEGFGTLFFLAPPRPEKNRRGALWVREHLTNSPGGLVLRRGGAVISTWQWGGVDGHTDGCYFKDANHALIANKRFGCAFSLEPGDALEYRFAIQNTTFTTYRYSATVQLFSGAEEGELVPVSGPIAHPEVEVKGRPLRPNQSPGHTETQPFTGVLPAENLTGGLYTVKFTLLQGTEVQDVKYIAFAVGYDEKRIFGSFYHDYRAKYDDLWNQGWQLHILDTHTEKDMLLYSAVWRKDRQRETQLYELQPQELRKQYDELHGQGWRLQQLNTVAVNNQLRFNAILRPGEGAEMLVFGRRYEEYRPQYDQLWRQGWRLHLLNVVVLDQTPLYTAVWRPGGQDEIQVYGWTYRNFLAKQEELRKAGWGLHSLNPYVLNHQTFYTAVWRRSREKEILACGLDEGQLQNKCDELWEEGMRLHRLSSYLLNNCRLYDGVWRPSKPN
ncbi:hypothetical protein GTO89_02130 [Heliobacterium gestii]|uniref:Uncharacterized protein n=1 Tax=Heliomicrobium gestii TaxID=2699 RepID=A0A845LAY8_HELGE|nr:hypothetical protein [Heliomicrobium gestii]MBM7865579.1 hypothetical protein [Heliomicrobium gestii]MZP41829.1 hypothetical protein [Heliomicrobium gestii]